MKNRFVSAWINLTKRCNMRCSYCFIDRYSSLDSWSGDMSEDTLSATVKYFRDNNSDGIMLTFFGGEPLLRFDMIRSVMDKHKTMSFQVSTNATLLTDEIVDYFVKKRNVVIGVYYASLLKELKYGAGMHPASYPSSRLNCGGAVEIAYEVRTSA